MHRRINRRTIGRRTIGGSNMYRRAIGRRTIGGTNMYRRTIGSKERKAARLIREAANLLEGHRRVIGRDISKNPRPTEEEIEALQAALYDYVEELNEKYAPLYDIFISSEEPEKDPRLEGVVEVEHKEWYDPYANEDMSWTGRNFVPIVPSEKVFNGIEIEIGNPTWAGFRKVKSEVGMPYLDDLVVIGYIHECFGSETEEYYEVTYESYDWDDIEDQMDNIERFYYGNRKHYLT